MDKNIELYIKTGIDTDTTTFPYERLELYEIYLKYLQIIVENLVFLRLETIIRYLSTIIIGI
jgi:hypothetical protein